MSKQTRYPKYELLGVEVDALTMDEANEAMGAWLNDPTHPSCYVVKPYVEFLDRASQDEPIRTLLNNAQLSLPDGVALSWATTYIYGGEPSFTRLLATLADIVRKPQSLQHYLPDRFAGANATWSLLGYCAKNHFNVFLIGSPKDGTIEQTAKVIAGRVPGIKIVGTAPGDAEKLYHAPKRSDDSELITLANRLTKTGADVILVGMGFPLQEAVMANLHKHLQHGILIGEGGTFDYDSFGGKQRRAPKAIQRIGLEWLWRLVLQPTRLGRQLAIPRFIYKIYRYGATRATIQTKP